MDRTKAFQTYINFARLLVERDRRIYRENFMPLEIKGLSGAALDAKKVIGELRGEMGGLYTDVTALTADVRDVRAQVKNVHDDLKFEAQTLGNSSGSAQTEQDKTNEVKSGEQQERPFPKPGAGGGAA